MKKKDIIEYELKLMSVHGSRLGSSSIWKIAESFGPNI